MEAEKVCGNVSETLHTLANEPSLGLYYVADHVQRSVPQLVASKQELCRTTELVKGADVDAGFGLENMRAATASDTVRRFESVERLASAAADRARAAPSAP
jgi:hypothetical protein